MRILLVMILLTGVFSSTLCAEFSYESRIQFTGGILLNAVLEMGPLGRGAKKPIVATHLIKGNRMATFTKDHSTIVDVDKETIVEIDFAKKTYFSMTFAQMKQILDKAMKVGVAHPNKGNGASPESTFQVSSKSTGRTNAIGFWTAKEQIFTVTLNGAGKEAERPQSVNHIILDSWLLSYPGFTEAEDFQRKLAGKLGYAYASGMSEIAMVKPELLPGFEELGQVMNQFDEAPAESTIKMWGLASGDPVPSVDESSPLQKSGVVSGALNRLGSMGRKKSAPSNEHETSSPGLLVEMTEELSDFNGGVADESKFNVPAGFKQVQPPAAKH